MMARKEVPIGIIFCIILIVGLDAVFLSYVLYSLLFNYEYLSWFLSVSLDSLIIWLNVVLTILSLLIVPYGFLKQKNGVRLFALIFLLWSAVLALRYVMRTGEKVIGFPFFVLYVLLGLYLLMSSVKCFFNKSSPAVASLDLLKGYTYGEYTLYTKLVRLKNEKLQIIYFFSKHKPKSGEPSALPVGFKVGLNNRSGLPYLKKE